MKRQQGSQTVEFALVALPFILLLLAIFELTRLLWVNMAFESAVNKAMRTARVMAPSYTTDQMIRTEIASFPMIDQEHLALSVPRYAKSLSDLANYRQSSASEASLGQYIVTYDFSFLLVPQLSDQFPQATQFKRAVLVAYDK